MAPFASLDGRGAPDGSRRAGADARWPKPARSTALESVAPRPRCGTCPGVVRRCADAAAARPAEDDRPAFLPLEAGETIAWDYRSSSHSVRGHPLAPLRPIFTRQGLPDARTVQTLPSGTRRALCRPGDLPPASGHGVERHVHDARGRNRLRQPRPLGSRVPGIFGAGADGLAGSASPATIESTARRRASHRRTALAASRCESARAGQEPRLSLTSQ